MKLKLKDKTVTKVVLNKQIYVVDKDGYVNIPDNSKVLDVLFEADTATSGKASTPTTADTSK